MGGAMMGQRGCGTCARKGERARGEGAGSEWPRGRSSVRIRRLIYEHESLQRECAGKAGAQGPGGREYMSIADTTAQQTRAEAIYSRVVLKLSGESLQGPEESGIHAETVVRIARELKEVHDMGVQMAIMVGGGNIFRGTRQKSLAIDRATGDYMGMLATVINGLALQDALEKQGVFTRLQSAIEMHHVAEPFIRRRAVRHLEKGRVVIFAAGTGNPYFSTDTAAALRAMEIRADVILKATRVDGVYDADPEKVKGAKRFERITYLEVLQKGLSVMDSTAISLCMDNRMPIVVFDMTREGNIKRVLRGEKVGSVVE